MVNSPSVFCRTYALRLSETGFFSESAGCNAPFPKKTRFLGPHASVLFLFLSLALRGREFDKKRFQDPNHQCGNLLPTLNLYKLLE